MADPKYDIYFRGEVLPGADEAQVRAAIAKIFKADDAKLAQLFSGKVNTIKKSVDKAIAAKYQQAFKNAGAKAIITVAKEVVRSEAAKKEPAEIVNAAVIKAHTVAAETQTVAGSWDILPSGSDLLAPDERRNIADADIDTSAIKMVSPFTEVEVVDKPIPPAPDTRHISVAEVGGDMNPDRPAPVAELELDLSEFTVAEVGVALADKKEKHVPPAPDTNHIKLV
ncbi:MAG: hypothetical protein V7765_12670 [Oleispira sp.]